MNQSEEVLVRKYTLLNNIYILCASYDTKSPIVRLVLSFPILLKMKKCFL